MSAGNFLQDLLVFLRQFVVKVGHFGWHQICKNRANWFVFLPLWFTTHLCTPREWSSCQMREGHQHSTQRRKVPEWLQRASTFSSPIGFWIHWWLVGWFEEKMLVLGLFVPILYGQSCRPALRGSPNSIRPMFIIGQLGLSQAIRPSSLAWLMSLRWLWKDERLAINRCRRSKWFLWNNWIGHKRFRGYF